MAKSTMQEEIEFTSQEYTSHTTNIDSYIRIIRGKIDDYEKSLSMGRYFIELEESICDRIKNLKELESQKFSYRTDDLKEIDKIFTSINESYFDIDEPLLDDYLEGRLVLKRQTVLN